MSLDAASKLQDFGPARRCQETEVQRGGRAPTGVLVVRDGSGKGGSPLIGGISRLKCRPSYSERAYPVAAAGGDVAWARPNSQRSGNQSSNSSLLGFSPSANNAGSSSRR